MLLRYLNHRIHVSGCCCFSDINISQGSVATHLRCDRIFYYLFTIKLLLSLSVKEFWKSRRVSGKVKVALFQTRCSCGLVSCQFSWMREWFC